MTTASEFHDDRADELIIPSLVFSVLTPIFVIARCGINRARAGRSPLDDYLLFAAAVLGEVGSIIMIMAANYGLGKHQAEVIRAHDAGSRLLDNTADERIWKPAVSTSGLLCCRTWLSP